MSKTGRIAVYFLLGLLGLALIAMLALPFWFGMQAQARFEATVAELNRQSAPMMRVETSRYDRGWLTSRAETLVQHAQLPVRLRITHELRHGPVHLPGLLNDDPALLLAMIDSRLGMGEAAGGQSMTLASGRTRVALNGDAASQWGLEEMLTAMLGSNRPVWLRADYRAADRQVTVQAQLPEASMQDPQGNGLRLDDLRLRLDAEPARNGDFMVGSYGISLKYLRAGGMADMTVVEDLRLRARAGERGDRLDTEMAVSFEKAESVAGTAGPGRLILQLNNLHAPSVAALAKAQEDLLSDLDPLADPQAQAALLMGPMMEILPAMLSQAELRIPTLYLATADGAMKGKARVGLPVIDPEYAAVPMALLAELELEADLAIDEPMMRKALEGALRTRLAGARQGELAEGGSLLREEIDEDAAMQTEAQLGVLASQGYLSLADGVYRTRLTLEQGSLLMNGRPLNPMALMQGGAMPGQ
ncbi:MAG: DUF945 family protein [Chromatiales bacterium]|nr:DUF945 family protein [Chromatiales bacterium]